MLYSFNARGSRISIITFPCVTWHTTHDTWHMAHSRVLPINWFLQIQNNLLTKCLQCHPLHWSLIPLVPHSTGPPFNWYDFNWSPIQLVPHATGPAHLSGPPIQSVGPIWSPIQLVFHSTGPPIQLVFPFNWSPHSTGFLFKQPPIQVASQSTGPPIQLVPQFNWSLIQSVPNSTGLPINWSPIQLVFHSIGPQCIWSHSQVVLPFNWCPIQMSSIQLVPPFN